MFNTRNKYGISAHPCIILYIYLLGCVKDEENVYLTIISIAISTISELNVLLESSLDFSGNAGGGWSLLGEVGTLQYVGGVLEDISVSLRP